MIVKPVKLPMEAGLSSKGLSYSLTTMTSSELLIGIVFRKGMYIYSLYTLIIILDLSIHLVEYCWFRLQFLDDSVVVCYGEFDIDDFRHIKQSKMFKISHKIA